MEIIIHYINMLMVTNLLFIIVGIYSAYVTVISDRMNDNSVVNVIMIWTFLICLAPFNAAPVVTTIIMIGMKSLFLTVIMTNYATVTNQPKWKVNGVEVDDDYILQDGDVVTNFKLP